MKEAIITILGGVAVVHTLPKGVKVKIVDFDCDGVEEERLEKFEGDDAVIGNYEGGEEVKEEMTYFLFLGMFQGLNNIARIFRKEKHAEEAFKEYTGFKWSKVNSSDKVCEKFGYTDFAGSEIQEIEVPA